MKIKLLEIPRKFIVGKSQDIEILDCGKIELDDNEMLSFVTSEGCEYDVCAKDWGFYATPSVNGRLVREGFKTALVKNSLNQYYVMLVDINKLESFNNYTEKENLIIVQWLSEL
jgi:hypothetical protein